MNSKWDEGGKEFFLLYFFYCIEISWFNSYLFSFPIVILDYNKCYIFIWLWLKGPSFASSIFFLFIYFYIFFLSISLINLKAWESIMLCVVFLFWSFHFSFITYNFPQNNKWKNKKNVGIYYLGGKEKNECIWFN